MHDAERNMGLKLKLLNAEDLHKGDVDYATGLITMKDVEELIEDHTEESELLGDAAIFKKNSRQVYDNIKSKFEDQISRIKIEEKDRL